MTIQQFTKVIFDAFDCSTLELTIEDIAVFANSLYNIYLNSNQSLPNFLGMHFNYITANIKLL